MERIVKDRVREVNNAIITLRCVSLRDIVNSMKFYDDTTPEEEWNDVLYDEVISYNSYVFAFLGERAIQCGEFRSECSILEEDGITVIYDHIVNDTRVYIDDNEVQLTGCIVGTSEILKLAEGLTARKIPFEIKTLYDGTQIKCDTWDAVCHSYSYGGPKGLLETMGLNINDCCEDGDGVQGFLEAEDILSYLDNMKEE